MKLRKEFDSIGSVNVPNDKLWGASTQRSNKFFNIGKISKPEEKQRVPALCSPKLWSGRMAWGLPVARGFDRVGEAGVLTVVGEPG